MTHLISRTIESSGVVIIVRVIGEHAGEETGRGGVCGKGRGGWARGNERGEMNAGEKRK